MRKWLAIGVALVAVAACGPTSESETEELEFGAFDVCRQFVTEQLRSPGSAQFRNFFEDDGEVVVTGTGSGPYTVRSSVDSQNALGALLRTDFVCTVKQASDGGWTLEGLSFSER